MDIVIVPFLQVIRVLLGLYSTGLFFYGLLMMLESFGIIDSYNKIIYRIHNTLFLIYNPVLEKVRAVFDFGPVDLSIMILWLFLFFIRHVLIRIIDLF